MTATRLFAALASIVIAVSCMNLGDASWDEVARVAAPTTAVDAVLIETNGGATTSFGYLVYVVPRGQSVVRDATRGVARLYGAARSDSAYGVALTWRDSTHLSLDYLVADFVELHDSLVTVSGRAIRVDLRAGIADSTAPAGGMLWNKQGRPQ